MAAPRLTGRARARNGRYAQDLRAESAREVVHRGRARLGKRTKLLVRRLKPGDIPVIDHADIDRVAADDLVARGVRCVLNAACSSSGRYPNPGPMILTEAGIHLVDVPQADVFKLIEDGDQLTVRGGEIYRDGKLIATGEVLGREQAHRSLERARQRIGEALAAFAENTIEHIRDERELLAGRIQLPEFKTSFRDKPALVVVRGVDHQKDLRILRPYVRDVRPVLVAVDGGADALIDDGFTPHMIVGDMDSATDAALRSGAELVVHAYPDGRAPGRERLDRLGLAYKVVPAPATSEDVAMLIAAEKGAELIVAVGSHFNLVEFLDKARNGMSSTFLTRLRVGEILVDAKGVSRLYRPSAGRGPLIIVTLAAMLVLAVVIVTSPTLGQFLDLVWLKIQILLGIK
ncbi:MAG TPA: putative cytokinetic ring protein SteA [Thermoleophilaceae bacterium]|nr:putative cytokinetic ring protein SteA [Thermoleophilaceae bacterium]